MDREKRRSEEHEAELDRRIALIREKNQQIEQRTKEIEEDRVRNEDSTAKSPKSSSQTPPKATTPDRTGNGQWSREWDKGKTPAETWRENVPSMDLKGKLAGQSGANNNNNNNNNNGGNAANNGNAGGNRKGGRGSGIAHGQKIHKDQKEGLKIPARLEGRISFPGKQQEEKEHGNSGGKRGGGDRKDGRGGNQGKGHKDGHQEKKSSVADGETQKGQRRRGSHKDQKEQKEQKEQNVKQQNSQKKEKDGKGGKVQPAGDKTAEEKRKLKNNRSRRESDNYAVRKVVHRMIDKICWMERVEKRKAKNELLGEQEELEEEPKSEDEVDVQDDAIEKTDDLKQSETKQDEKDSETSPEAPIDEVPQTPSPAHDEKGEKDITTDQSSEDIKEDRNQNVISLVREKVVTMTTSQVL
ncbi:unnamed protein product [Caenorhabditis brenneri]